VRGPLSYIIGEIREELLRYQDDEERDLDLHAVWLV
jgi:hypothetical protein